MRTRKQIVNELTDVAPETELLLDIRQMLASLILTVPPLNRIILDMDFVAECDKIARDNP